MTSIGEPALRRVYGDWQDQNLKSWGEQIQSLGLQARQETANTKQKNATDIGMVIDAMDILHSGRFDGFVLVSSDSDFTALANRLREAGLSVIGMGESKTPEALRNVCNRFILVENLSESEQAGKPKTTQKDLNRAFQLLSNAIRKKSDQENEWISLSIVSNLLLAAHPDFDHRSFGHTKLSNLVRALPKLELNTEAKKLLVRIKP